MEQHNKELHLLTQEAQKLIDKII